MSRILTLTSVCVLTGALSSAYAAVIHVPAEQPTIQAAINAAVAGDEVVVAPGTYVETINFNGRAITLRSSDGPEVTIIDGNSTGSVVTCESGEGPDTVLEGFTITGGNGTYDATVTADAGGGMYNVNSDPTVTRCVFRQNVIPSSGSYGGGMYNRSSNPTVTHCSFDGNTVSSRGGGMCNVSSCPTVIDCDFISNTGGGMYNSSECIMSITNCKFILNSASAGGGIHNYPATTMVTNCLFRGNTATHPYQGNGGAVKNSFGFAVSWFTNCTFISNTANDVGGGMWNYAHDPVIRNCIFWGNTDETGATATAQIHNNHWTSTPTVSYSDIQGGVANSTHSIDGGHNADSDPLYADSNGHLMAGSLCIDAGNNYAVPPGVTTDLDGNPRVIDGTVDMGAYEFGGGCQSTSACPNADVDCNNIVNGLDIAIMTSSANFGQTAANAAEPRADVDGSGVVNGLDVAAATSSACYGL